MGEIGFIFEILIITTKIQTYRILWSANQNGSCYVINSYVIRIKDLVIQPFVYRLIKTDNTKSPPNLFILIFDLCHVIFNFVSRDVQ